MRVTLLAILFFASLLLEFRAHAQTDDVVTMQNQANVNGCIQVVNGEARPNQKNALCKIVSNVPGEKETKIVVTTVINDGTLLNPKERPTQLEYTLAKENGKIKKLDIKVTDLSRETKPVDVYSFEYAGTDVPKSGQAIQSGKTYALPSRDMCMPFKAYVDSFGAETVKTCSQVLQAMMPALKGLQAELAEKKQSLAMTVPAKSTPSLTRFSALNAERTAHTMSFLGSCAMVFQAEAPVAAPPAASGDGAQAPAAPEKAKQ